MKDINNDCSGNHHFDYYYKTSLHKMKTAQNLTSVFNIPEIENEDEVDYKKLF